MTNCTFSISAFEQVKTKVLNWAKQFDTFSFLDNHFYQNRPHAIECLLAAGVKRSVTAKVPAARLGTNSSDNHKSVSALQQLQDFIDEKPSWLFGHLGYDLKNEIEELSSSHPDPVGFDDLFFFEPEILIKLSENQISIEADDPGKIFEDIQKQDVQFAKNNYQVQIKSKLDRQSYILILEQLKEHIHRGDCYEINFCQEFFVKHIQIDPITVYQELSKISPNPFSALYRVNDRWLVCASPERYLKKTGRKILSQPIKGTLKRDSTADQKGKQTLFESQKDRSENVMIVDLVRNDLSRICKNDSVKVDELFGVYVFPQVYQMISTVSGELRNDISFSDIIRATFPMGSMTGAPKKRVLELIEEYEITKRGIFSGAVGYIDPSGDFDFNVVIRSIMYNDLSKYLSFQAGSGITFYSDPEKEWEECLLKAEAIRQVLK